MVKTGRKIEGMGKMKLKAGYVERRVYGRDRRGAMYIILTPDGHVWPREGAEEKHPECFEPEQKCPFQKDDWIRGPLWRNGQSVKTFLRVFDPTFSDQDISALDGKGGLYLIRKIDAELIECSPSRPKGPPVVGSYVQHVRYSDCIRGIVTEIFGYNRPAPFHVRWMDDTWNWYAKNELIHIASPDNYEQ